MSTTEIFYWSASCAAFSVVCDWSVSCPRVGCFMSYAVLGDVASLLFGKWESCDLKLNYDNNVKK